MVAQSSGSIPSLDHSAMSSQNEDSSAEHGPCSATDSHKPLNLFQRTFGGLDSPNMTSIMTAEQQLSIPIYTMLCDLRGNRAYICC